MISAAPPPSGGGQGFLPILFLVGLLALMYFMVIRPQQRRRKQMQSMQDELVAGTDVLTIGGLYGTIVGVDDESVTLEVAPGVTNRYARGAIARVVSADADLADSPAEATDDGGPDVATSEEPVIADNSHNSKKELR